MTNKTMSISEKNHFHHAK